MSMLTVVGNPRGRKRRHTKKRRRSTRARATTHKRRRRTANPAPHRRRRSSGRRRHRNPSRRRRHHNPLMGGVTKPLMTGVAIGAGMYATSVAAAAVNAYLLKTNPVTGIAKTAVKAGIALIGLPMLLKFIPGGKKFIGAVMLGGGAIVAQDLLAQFATPALPAELHDGDTLKGYDWGSLSAYRNGALSGWAPQSGVSGWAPQTGVSGLDEDPVFGGGPF